MSRHRDREDSAAGVDLEHTRRHSRSARAPAGPAPDRSLAPAGNEALTRLLRPGHLPAAPSRLAPAGNAAVARLMRTTSEQPAELPAHDAGPLNPSIAAAIDAERGGGAPLPDGIRTEMEGHLGIDLSPVRVHTGHRADSLNRAVSAQAFTSGTDVFFSQGSYHPTSPSGRELLAHELTHVARPAGAGGQVSHPTDPAEVEAREVARRIARSAPSRDSGSAADRADPGQKAPEAGAARSAADQPARHRMADVLREQAAAPPADGLAGNLTDADHDQVSSFMVVVGDYDNAAADAVDQMPAPVVAGGALQEVERRWLQTWQLIGQPTPEATQQFSAHWDRLRPDLDAVATWAAGQGYDRGFVARYHRGVQRIESLFILRHSEQVIDARLPMADVGNPEAVYEQVVAEQIAAAARSQLAVVQKSESLLAKAGPAAKTGGKSLKTGKAILEVAKGDEAAVPAVGTGPALRKLGGDGLKSLLSILAKSSSLKEKIDGYNQQSDVAKAATVVSGVELLVEVSHTVILYAGHAAEAAGAKAGEKLMALAGTLDSQAVKDLGTMSKMIGVSTSVLGIAASTLTLIDAIQTGDERATAHGVLNLAGGVAELGLTFAGGGAVPGVIVGGYVFMWKLMVDIMGELGALLRQAELDAKARRAAGMVGHAGLAADAGRRMITAWEEAQLRKTIGAASTESAVAQALEASAGQAMTELGTHMNEVLQDLGGFRDDPDVAGKVRQDLAAHLATIAIDFGRGAGPYHPHEVTELCRTVFADVNAVVREILGKAGLPATGPPGR